MDKNKLLEISNIKNLQSIKIDRLMDTPDIKDPGVIVVFYEDGKKSLTYCELDEEYLYFFSTIRRVYNEEKNKRNIYIDDLSKKFLETNEPKIELTKLKKQIGSIGGNKKINYNKLQVDMYYNILKYLLENLFTYFNRQIEINELKGMGKHFKFIFEEEGLESDLPFTYIEKDESVVELIFPGIFNSKELYIELNFNEKITARLHDSDNKLLIEYEIITTPEYGKLTKNIYLNGILNSKVIEELEKVNNNVIFDYKVNGTTYLLPWKDTRSIDVFITENELKSEIIKYTDFFSHNENIQIREQILQNLTKKDYGKNRAGGYKIKGDLNIQIDDEIIVTNYYKVDNYIIKETSYIGSNLTRGIFKSELEGKSFYKIYELSNETELKELISEITENIKGYELINKRELKKLIHKRSEF